MTGWRVARGAVLGGALGIAVALPLAEPVWTLRFWQGVVPLLPILFLVSPGTWRNVCPLATVGDGGPVVEGRATNGSAAPLGAVVVALVLLISLRPALFEASGWATSGLLAGVGVFAFAVGRRRPRKSGFCNRLCPILPVEQLYGQAPLIRPENERCGPCDGCTPRGCLDLAGPAALPQLLTGARRGSGWLATPFGAFAGAFPGIVVGFSAAVEPAPWAVLTTMVLAGFASWLTVAVVVRATGLAWAAALPLLAALALGAHLWLALPGVVRIWEVPVPPAPLQLAALGGVAAWTVYAIRMRAGRSVPIGVRRG